MPLLINVDETFRHIEILELYARGQESFSRKMITFQEGANGSDRLRTGKPFRYVTSHRGQLRLAIPPWVGVMSTGEKLGSKQAHLAIHYPRIPGLIV